MELHELYQRLNAVYSIEPKSAKVLVALAAKAIKGDFTFSENKETRIELHKRTRPYFGVQANNGSIEFKSMEALSDAPAGSIALIRINGFISYQSDWCNKGLEEYEREMIAAGQNQNIKGVILQVNSGGGSIEGVDNFSDFVAGFEAKYGKPLVALVDSRADSAAYHIICQAPRIFSKGEACEVGSIGTFVTLSDYTEYLAEMGIKEIDVYASKSFNKNAEYNDAVKGDTSKMVAYLDKYNNMMIRDVERGRAGVLNTEIRAVSPSVEGQPQIEVAEVFTGKVYVGREMVSMGLIDEISDMEGVVRYVNQKAAEMGWGGGSGKTVETEDESEDDWNYMYQNSNNTMFKNLNDQTLQASFDKATGELEAIANSEAGIGSKEYVQKANQVAAIESELHLRAANKKAAELQAQLEQLNQTTISAEQLTAVQNELTAAKGELQKANEDLNAANDALKQAQTANDALKAENDALKQQEKAYTEFFAQNGIDAPKKVAQSLDAPLNDGNQPSGTPVAQPEMTAAQMAKEARETAKKINQENKQKR